uniref:Choline transporter-like protein n=1 Tax=Dendroctonus ponderosae TaxID=77166 RepID=A0AAR5PP27_DENPD
MGLNSSILQPEELIDFKKLAPNVSLDAVNIPEIPANRKATNVRWLITLIASIVILIPFLIYTMMHSDIKRLTVGYDSCGDVCGEINQHRDGVACSGQDLTTKPYIKYDDTFAGADSSTWTIKRGSCLATCPNEYLVYNGVCLKQSTIRHQNAMKSTVDYDYENYDSQIEDEDLASYYASIKWQLIISCFLSILIAMGLLILFRFNVSFMVWAILIGSVLALFVFAIFAWIVSQQMTVGIILSVCAVLYGILLICFRKRVQLVILMLKEATKAVFRMPRLMAVPFVCFITIGIITAVCGLLTAYMLSSGTLQADAQDSHSYVMNPVMIASIVLNIVVYLWICQFLMGIQYMIIAGAVCKWYFCRDKNVLSSPILTSAGITFKYHLGTIALGSLIILQIQIFKALLKVMMSHRWCRNIAVACLNYFEEIFRFLSKNAYIVTAMHGQGFFQSGKRAVKLLVQNISNVIALNFIGDFVLAVAVVIVVVISVSVSAFIFHLAPGTTYEYITMPYLIVGCVSLVAGTITFGVIESTVDTVYLCYCEDVLLNDGRNRPYFMSRALMEFFEKSKKAYKK